MFRVWQRATGLYEAMGESDIMAGSDGPILKIEHGFPWVFGCHLFRLCRHDSARSSFIGS